MIRVLLAFVLAPAVVVAQGVPPAPTPRPAPRPAPLPRPEVHVEVPLEIDVERLADQARWAALDAVNDLDVAEIAENARRMAADLVHDIDVSDLTFQAQELAFDIAHGFDVASVADNARWMAQDAVRNLGDLRADLWSGVEIGSHSFAPSGGRGYSTSPPASWAKDDPADSLWRAAREALNRGDYRRASQLFNELSTRYANSRYTADALYWRAVALYRIGGTAELREALTVLQTQKSRYPQTRSDPDPALATRILGALAARGDADAQRQLEANAARGLTTCDREADAVRAEALNALARLDPESSAAILRQVLTRRDECSTRLRSRAVFLLGQRNDPANASVLIDVMRNDPDPEIRAEAMGWLARMPGEENIAALESVVTSSDDERMQRAAIRALAAASSPRARQAVRAVIERESAPIGVRREAIRYFGDRERATAEDAAYLRALYGRLGGGDDAVRLKQSIAATLARLGGPENEQWLMALARNENEPAAARTYALEYLASSRTPIAEVARAYDAISQRDMRERIISILGRRTEPQATDKLIEIAKTGTDPNLRRRAISALSRKKDPRTTKLLLEIINP